MAQHDKYIWDYFKAKLNNEYGTAGLMGNLYAESGLYCRDPAVGVRNGEEA